MATRQQIDTPETDNLYSRDDTELQFGRPGSEDGDNEVTKMISIEVISISMAFLGCCHAFG